MHSATSDVVDRSPPRSGDPRQLGFDDLGTPLCDVTFCVVDIETTGTAPSNCGITEIGAVKVRHGEVLGTFQTLVNPGEPIPAPITLLTGITESMVVDAPFISEVIPSFLEFLGNGIIVGHNIRFDLGFLNAAANRFGYGQISNPSVDTLALARRLIQSEVRNLRLGTLAAHLRSPVSPDHRALSDAKATLHVFHSLLEKAGSIGVTGLEDLLSLPRAKGSPHYEKLRLARDLPRLPGVYLFRNRDGEVVYVGKTRNLRNRVSSYFYGDSRRSTADLLRQLDSVDHIVCSGNLHASVIEHRLIHSHRPRFNRIDRPPKANHYLSLTVETFPRLSVTRGSKPGSGLVLGPFRSLQAAEKVRAAIWEAVPIRRCSGSPGSKSGLCTSAQLGLALCPCNGDLSEDEYRPVVERLIEGVRNNPQILLDSILERIRQCASNLRYEEAASSRDRYEALKRAIERQWQWESLMTAGRFEALHPDGECAVIDHGHLAESWIAGETPPLLPDPAAPHPNYLIPPNVGASVEANLIWKWISEPGVEIVDGDTPIPPPMIPSLDSLE